MDDTQEVGPVLAGMDLEEILPIPMMSGDRRKEDLIMTPEKVSSDHTSINVNIGDGGRQEEGNKEEEENFGEQTEAKEGHHTSSGYNEADLSEGDGYKQGDMEDNISVSNSFESSPLSEESKREAETNKAVTFAEDIEVYDLSLKRTSPITVSLDTPVCLVDQPAILVPESQNDPMCITDLPDKIFQAQSEVEQEIIKKTGDNEASEQPYPARPSVLSLVKDSGNTKNLGASTLDSSAVLQVDSLTADGEKELEKNEDVSESTQMGDEGLGPKQFTVLNVEESELSSSLKDQEKEGLLLETMDKLDTLPFLSKAQSTQSDGTSGQSTDSNYQDTIGPLENPAFLRTLQYSVSQPFDQDEHFGINSNLDLTSLPENRKPPDLDGGWAWVVLFSAFISLAIIGATVYSAGVLLKAVLEVIDPDLTKASWIGSVHVSTQCVAGPFVGASLKRFGARLTICCAGIVITLGFIGASFSTSVIELIITHGLIAGIGAGYVINPLFVTVGQYFNQYRGLACGILATGAGAGMLAGGAAISSLLDRYGLSGTYLLWSGVVFHITALGMLMRPSPEERYREMEREININPESLQGNSQHELNSARNSMLSGLNSLYSSVDQNSMLSGLDRISHGKKSSVYRNSSKLSNGDVDAPLLKAVLHREMSRSSHSVSTSRSQHRPSHPMSPTQSNKLSPTGDFQSPSPVMTPTGISSPIAFLSNSNPHQSSPHHQVNHLSTSHLNSSLSLGGNSTHLATSATPTPHLAPSSPISTQGLSSLARSYRSRLQSTSSQPQSHHTSLSHISQRLSMRDGLQHHGDLDNESLASTLVSQLRPRDALTPRYTLGSRSISTLMGSIASFPTALAIVKDDLIRLEGGDEKDKRESVMDCITGVLDNLRLLRNKSFLVFISSAFVWALGESPVMIYLPSYAISQGTGVFEASSLYTAMGIGSMMGRLLSGLLATDRSVGPVLLQTGCLAVSGMILVLSPLMFSSLPQQVIFSVLVGIYTGSLVPLTSLLTIELLGLEDLALGFGFLSMAQGVGYLVGPPFASIIVGALGFEKSFVVCGFILILSSLMAMGIPVMISNAEEEDANSLADLEQALQRVNNSDSEDEEDEEGMEEEEQMGKSVASSLNKMVEVKKDKGDEMKTSESRTADTKGERPVPLLEVENSESVIPAVDGGEEKLETILEVIGK